MGINVSKEMEYMAKICHEIADKEKATPRTKIDAIMTLKSIVDMAVGINRLSLMMEGMDDDRK